MCISEVLKEERENVAPKVLEKKMVESFLPLVENISLQIQAAQ